MGDAVALDQPQSVVAVALLEHRGHLLRRRCVPDLDDPGIGGGVEPDARRADLFVSGNGYLVEAVELRLGQLVVSEVAFDERAPFSLMARLGACTDEEIETHQAARIRARRLAMISSASRMVRSISSLTVGMSRIRPATMPHDQAPASISPCFMMRGDRKSVV